MRAVPSAGAAVAALAQVTWLRLRRGKAMWIAALFALLPAIFASLVRGQGRRLPQDGTLFELVALLLVVIPAMFVGASVGEELEDRTSTYLWSRPIARWAVLAGKLVALAPIAIALVVGGWVLASQLAEQALPSAHSCVALAAGGLVASLAAAAIATLMPKHGMAMTIGYMLVDLGVGAMPFSFHALAITHQVRALSTGEVTSPAIGLVAIAAVWTALALVRIRRLEA